MFPDRDHGGRLAIHMTGGPLAGEERHVEAVVIGAGEGMVGLAIWDTEEAETGAFAIFGAVPEATLPGARDGEVVVFDTATDVRRPAVVSIHSRGRALKIVEAAWRTLQVGRADVVSVEA